MYFLRLCHAALPTAMTSIGVSSGFPKFYSRQHCLATLPNLEFIWEPCLPQCCCYLLRGGHGPEATRSMTALITEPLTGVNSNTPDTVCPECAWLYCSAAFSFPDPVCRVKGAGNSMDSITFGGYYIILEEEEGSISYDI